jgi:hypothetical protein
MPLRSTLVLSLASGLVCSAALAGGGASPPAGRALRLRSGDIDTAAPAPALAGSLPSIAKGTRVVVQLEGPITPTRRAALEAAGVRLGDYLPDHAYIASVDAADPARVAALGFVRWWSPYQAAWKLDPELGTRAYTTPQRRALLAKGRDRMVVTLFEGANSGVVERAIGANPGAAILGEELVGGHLELTAELPLGAARALAADPGVQFIEPAPEITARNVGTRWIVQSNVVNVRPLYDNGLRGEGQVLGLLDNGFNQAHCSFSDAAPVGPTHRKILALNGSFSTCPSPRRPLS